MTRAEAEVIAAADRLVDFILDQATYPLHYDGEFRERTVKLVAARARMQLTARKTRRKRKR